jgi:hypothetical protein
MTRIDDGTTGGNAASKTYGMVAELVLIVNSFWSLLSAYPNGEELIRMRMAEVERIEGVGGLEMVL